MVYEVSCDDEECVFEDGGLCIKSRLTMSDDKCTSKVHAGTVSKHKSVTSPNVVDALIKYRSEKTVLPWL
jgi:hypothetical protein